jgi:hypothetical protein
MLSLPHRHVARWSEDTGTLREKCPLQLRQKNSSSTRLDEPMRRFN